MRNAIGACCLTLVLALAARPLAAQGADEPPPADYAAQLYPPAAECPECPEGACLHHGGGSWLHELGEFTSRNSATHGRAVGLGAPLRGTSWLNRPFETSVDFGALIMTGRPATGVRSSNDLFVAVSSGWDWDHYWGTRLRLGWSTPQLDNPAESGDESDNLFIADASLMYYPWGDSRVRPYWRLGAGLTDLEFTNVNGARQQEFLYTIPIGVGVKHMWKRWLVWRAELADNLAIGANEARTMNNLTLTFGLEARWGGAPDGYWAWRPRGHAW